MGLGWQLAARRSPSPAISPPRSPGGSRRGATFPVVAPARRAGRLLRRRRHSASRVVGGWRLLNRLGTELTQVGMVPAPWPVRHRARSSSARSSSPSSRWWWRCHSASAPPSTSPSTPTRGCAGSIKPIIEILAGIPSVVLAYFAIAFINPNIVVRLLRPAEPSVHDARRRPRRRRADDPDHRVGRRGRACAPCRCRCARPPSASARRRAQTTFRVVFPAGDLGHRRRADPRHLPSRSARRWSSPSPPAPSAARCSTLTRSTPARR